MLADRRAAFDPVARVDVVDAADGSIAAWWMWPQMMPSTLVRRASAATISWKWLMKLTARLTLTLAQDENDQ